MDPTIVDGFVAANANPRLLDVRAMRSLGASTVTHQELDRLLRRKLDDPWSGFYRRYPKATGYIELSVPVFSRDRSHAIAYCGHHWGSLAAHGDLVFLERTGDQWVIVRMEGLWTS